MTKTQFILYVKDQQKSADFYKAVLNQAPVLDVPGMTEFRLSEDTLLGLMPESGIKKILRDFTPDPSSGNGIPRCEIYLYVESPSEYLSRSVKSGAVKIDDEKPRDWGDSVAYCADPDGHILAFAKSLT
jgi:catechol 2,3-dioxygenase-like lactoylglutathione lyase family enzyme